MLPLASLVTVFVSVLSTVIVVPVCDTEAFVPPTNVRSPEVKAPVVPPLILVMVSVEEISKVGVFGGDAKVPCVIDVAPPAINVISPSTYALPVLPLSLVIVSVSTELIVIVLVDAS